MNYACDVIVESTWEVVGLPGIANKILWKDQLCELTEESNADNCFEMIRPDSRSDAPEPCTIKFVLKNNLKFTDVQILSEVSMVEVYGQHGEYLQTVRGALLDNIDNTPLYENHIKLSKWQSEVLLKFCRINSAQSIWIYGISVVTKFCGDKHKISYSSLPFNEAELGKLLLSMKANKSKPKETTPPSIMTDDINLSKLPQSTGKPQQKDLEEIIDEKLLAMEQRLMKHIDDCFHNLEHKMNKNTSDLINVFSVLETK